MSYKYLDNCYVFSAHVEGLTAAEIVRRFDGMPRDNTFRIIEVEEYHYEKCDPPNGDIGRGCK